MPTYMVFATDGLLGNGQKREIAKAITRAHVTATGAPNYYAQVIFHTVAENDYFVGGAPVGGPQIFVRGEIRSGRPLEVKQAIMEAVLDDVAACAGLERCDVWCYVTDLPAGQMSEYGRVMPSAGEEAAWVATLPPRERARIETLSQKKL